MRKLKLLLAVCALLLGAGQAWAQTDVTSLFISNPNFEGSAAITTEYKTYHRDVTDGCVSGLIAINGWTPVEGTKDARAGGPLAYGSSLKLSGSEAPATKPEGGQNETALGIVAVWNTSSQYLSETVSLPAGEYTIKVLYYNKSTNNKDISKNLIGFKESDGTEHYGSTKIFTKDDWSTETITFTLESASSGQFSLGYAMGNNGNNDVPHLFIDNIKVEYTGDGIAEPTLGRRAEISESVSLSHFVPNEGNYTLEVEGTVGTPITVAGAGISYTPVEDGTVRFAKKDGNVYVYEGATYKTSVAFGTPAFAPDIFTIATAEGTDNLLKNGSFETLGDQISDGKYKFGTPWTSNVTEGETGVRIGTSGDTHRMVWRGRSNSNYFGQAITGLKPNYKYQISLSQVDHGNGKATWKLGFGTEAGKIDLCNTEFTLGGKPDKNDQNGIWYATITTPSTVSETTTYYFTFLNGDKVDDTNDPLTQIDWIALAEQEALPITGVSSAKYTADGAFRPATPKDAYDDALLSATTALANGDYSNITGKEKKDLEALTTAAEPTTAEGYNSATAQLQSAEETFVAAKDSYDAYATAKAAADGVIEADVLAVVISGNDEATAADALTASVILPKAKALEAATATEPITTEFVVNGTFDNNVNGWTSTGGFQNTGLKNAKSGTLDKFWENWTPSENAAANKMYQTINNIPNGTYRLNISAFVNIVDGSTQYVFANNDKTNLTAVANPGADYEVYTVVTNNTLEIGLEQTAATANWMGIDNVSLNYFGTGNKIEAAKNAAHKLYWDEALAAATTAKNDAAYQNVTGNELTTLNTEIGKEEPSNADGYDAATEALKAATLAFKNAKDSYDAFVAAAAKKYTEDKEKYPYASHDKFAAIATAQEAVPTSAEDAVTKTTAIISAYRKYVESNALAEGVSGAVNMTDLIDNPNFEGVTIDGTTAGAWTFDQPGGSVDVKNNESFTDGDGNSNYSYFDYYNASNNNQNVHQTIENVAPGRYLLTATGRGHANFNGNLKLYVVNKGSVNIPAVGNSGGDFGRGWNDVSLVFELETASDITIGVQTTNSKAEWWSVTRFRLVQLEATPIADDSDYSDLNSAISTAEAYELGFDEGQYAPYNNVAALEALATAKAINQEKMNNKSTIKELTETLNGATWTQNATDVEIVYNGMFTTVAEGKDYPKGWKRTNGWGQMQSGIEGDFATAYYNQPGSLKYGNQGVYLMPLAANTTYKLTFSYRSHEDNSNSGMTVSVLNGEDGLAEAGFRGNGSKTNWITVSKGFVTGAAGNYVLTLANGGNTWITNVSIVKVASEEIEVTAAGYATYASDFALDFTGKDIKAYTAKVEEGKIVLTPIEKVAAGVPVVLYYEGGKTESIPLLTDDADDATDNQLVRGTGAAVATTDGDYTNYILNNVDGIGFYKANDKMVATNRAYLPVLTSEIPTTARLTIVFEDATGVSDVRGKMSDVRGEIYNLNGQRVVNAKKGLYIIGGKKKVIK